MKSRVFALFAAVAVSTSAFAAPALFEDNFNSASNANWTVLKGTTAAGNLLPADNTTQAATFGFDYSTFGIPAAPGSSSTLGLRVQSNIYGGVQSGLSTFLTGFALPSTYQISVQVWSNYVNTGSNSTEAATFGIGSGTKAQVVALNSDGTYVSVLRDNAVSTVGTYRTYTNGAFVSGIVGSTLAADFPAHPFAQTGPVNGTPTVNDIANTVAGTMSFAWRTVTITNDGTNVIFAISNDLGGKTTVSTVSVASLTAGTFGQAFLGSIDTNNGSSAANEAAVPTSAPAAFNFELFDNFVVVPEPSSAAMLAPVALMALRRRRK